VTPLDFEIEFFPVGDLSKAGDAIAVRYGINGNYRVIVIDGGTEDSGNALVEHLKTEYGKNTVVDHAISTHPDIDHASGLRKVLEQFPVNNLWIHPLWHHASEILPLFDDKRCTVDGLARRIKSEYPIVSELIDLAVSKKTQLYAPFEGAKIGPFTVLSPSKAVYFHLIPQFRKTPDANVHELKRRNMWLGAKDQTYIAKMLERAKAKVSNWVSEKWDYELLREDAITAAENETSTVLYGDFGSSCVLLTADAGQQALWWAIQYAQKIGIDLSRLALVQVPHHGSRSNVTPSVLNRLLGPRLPRGSVEKRKAIVSAPKDDENHPRKMVLNAFLRRGAGVRITQGQRYRFHTGTMPARSNETTAKPLGFFEKVEAYDD
jgi:beta-lactamase superfamily II metal-dependent hydrolase